MKKQKAFTLVELLVVISIIALVMALRMYVDENDGATAYAPNQGLWDNGWQNPPRIIKYKPSDNLAYWGIAYFPFAKNKKIFSCQSAKRVDDWPELGSP